MRDADAAALTALLAEPAVARWWHGYDAARVRAEYIAPVEPDEHLTVWIIEHDGAVAGLIQAGEEPDPMYRHASVDLFLGSAFHGRGLGPEAIGAVLAHLFGARGHHRVVIDPAADNLHARRAYAKVGFRVVGTMRQYERGADGAWHDGVLMELLAEEFYPGSSGGGSGPRITKFT